MERVDVNGTELAYLRRGDGEPLLLIMGMGGSKRHWGEPFLSELERDFDVVAFDNRGIGDSGRLVGQLEITQMADDAAGVLAALGLDSAHVVGISMGGMIAQELVLRHRDRVRTLTLGATYAGGPGSMPTAAAVVDEITQAVLSGDAERSIATSYKVNLSPSYSADPRHYDEFYAITAETRPAVDVLMAQASAVSRHDASERLALIDAPTLVVHGTEDLMLDAANGRLIADRIPGARLELLAGVGHMFWWEEPVRSAALLREHAAAAAQSAAPTR